MWFEVERNRIIHFINLDKVINIEYEKDLHRVTFFYSNPEKQKSFELNIREFILLKEVLDG